MEERERGNRLRPASGAPSWPADGLLTGSPGRPGTPDGLAGVLADWAATVRHHDDTVARSRRHWLRQQLEEESTLSGLLVDLAERGVPVAVQVQGHRSHRGVVVAVATDCAVLRSRADHHVLVTYRGIAWVRPEQSPGTLAGDRGVSIDLGLADLLAELVGERPRVLIESALDQGAVLTGQLLAVGQDVVTVRLDAGVRTTVYVPILSISAVSVEA